jgi:hypothetical protein
VLPARSLGEDAVLDLLELGLEGIEDGEIPVDHRVHERVQDVCGAMAQELGLALAARPHVQEAALRAAAHRQRVVPADEDVDLTHRQLVVGSALDHVENDEQRIAVLLDLRTLMSVAGILDGQRMQVELLLHGHELGLGGIGEGDPYEAPWPLEIIVNGSLVDVGELVTVLVGDAVD